MSEGESRYTQRILVPINCQKRNNSTCHPKSPLRLTLGLLDVPPTNC